MFSRPKRINMLPSGYTTSTENLSWPLTFSRHMQTGEYPYDASALLNPLYKCNISLSCGKICWPAQTTSDPTNHQLVYTWIPWPSYLKSSSVTISVSIALTSFALSTCFILKNRGVDKIQTHSSRLEWRLLMYQTLQYRVAACNVTSHKTTQHPLLRYFCLFINCMEWKW